MDTLRSKLFLTDSEQLEEVRLKKLKLSLKDEMERLRRLGALSFRAEIGCGGPLVPDDRALGGGVRGLIIEYLWCETDFSMP